MRVLGFSVLLLAASGAFAAEKVNNQADKSIKTAFGELKSPNPEGKTSRGKTVNSVNRRSAPNVTVRVIDGVEHYFYSGNDIQEVISLSEGRIERYNGTLESLRSRLESMRDPDARILLKKKIMAVEKERDRAASMAEKYRKILETAAPDPAGTEPASPSPDSLPARTDPASSPTGTSSSRQVPSAPSGANTPLSESEREQSESARARLEETNLDSRLSDRMSDGGAGLAATLESGADRLAASGLPDGAGPEPAPRPREQARGAAGKSNPANPQTPSDLLLASVSGFGSAFKQEGLRAAVGANGAALILRQDGTPATEKEIRNLRARIESEPEALLTRPDFFKVLPRARFTQLQSAYRSRGDALSENFRHVGMQRDFRWTQSCERLSGNCNSHTASLSYEKDQFVDPEDLDAILASIEASRGDGDEDPNVAYAREKLARRRFDGRKKGGLLSGLMGLLGRLTGSGGGADSIDGGGAPRGRGGVARADGVSRYPVTSVKSGPVPRDGKRLPPEMADPNKGARRVLLWIACLAAAGALFVLGLYRRNRENS